MPITTKVVSLNPAHGDEYSEQQLQLYSMKFCQQLSADPYK